MKLAGEEILLSAADLSNHIACKHLTSLNLAAVKGVLQRPDYRNAALAVLQERGLELEQNWLKSYKDRGYTISEPADDEFATSVERTISAMRSGVDVIYQAGLRMGNWQGRADFLIKTKRNSKLGDWSYEVYDSKLARETRIGTIVQLCLYSEILADLQGEMPEYMHVITPAGESQTFSYRLYDFLAYYRYAKVKLGEAIKSFTSIDASYPTPCAHCDVCNWGQYCDSQRRKDDHLCYVAGLSNTHTSELHRQDVTTLQLFADLPVPLPFRPQKGSVETFERLREQARVQLSARTSGKPIFEVLELFDGKGLFKLPNPSPGDIFFDFEGDPFVGNSGLEYLFGWATNLDHDYFKCLWAFNERDERRAFETFVDIIMAHWLKYPDMHIYHFTAYDPSALKRLMGKYATKENEIDRMLRAGLFVDLHTIAKQAIRAGIETYSLKELEKFHGFVRNLDLKQASTHLNILERHIERNRNEQLPEDTKKIVEEYNKEDCFSTMRLRN